MIIDDLAVIIPAYKPGDSLPELVRDLKENGFKRIIVVDDGNGPDMSNYVRRFIQNERDADKCNNCIDASWIFWRRRGTYQDSY